MAGGSGSRVSKILTKPKCLVEVNGFALIDWQIQWLKLQGVSRLIIAIGHQSELIYEHFRWRRPALPISFSYESQPLGTGGAVVNALNNGNVSGDFCVINGDTLISGNLQDMVVFHVATQALCTIGYVPASRGDAQDYGGITLNEDSRVLDFSEKSGENSFVSTGVCVFSTEAFRTVKLGFLSLERDIIPAISAQRRCYAYQFRNFYDIGTVDRLHKILQGECTWEE